jgi:chorismate mutase
MSDEQATSCPEPVALLDLLARQHELYRELHRLACAQRELIAAEDPVALLNLLSQRQKLIDQLAGINAALEPARADWRRVESMLTDQQRRQAQTIVQQVEKLLADILRADEADSKTLSARKAMIGRQIQATAASAQVQAAYRKTAGPVKK